MGMLVGKRSTAQLEHTEQDLFSNGAWWAQHACADPWEGFEDIITEDIAQWSADFQKFKNHPGDFEVPHFSGRLSNASTALSGWSGLSRCPSFTTTDTPTTTSGSTTAAYLRNFDPPLVSEQDEWELEFLFRGALSSTLEVGGSQECEERQECRPNLNVTFSSIVDEFLSYVSP